MITMANVSDRLCDIADELDKTKSIAWAILMAGSDAGLTSEAANAIQAVSQVVEERLGKALNDLKDIIEEVDR